MANQHDCAYGEILARGLTYFDQFYLYEGYMRYKGKPSYWKRKQAQLKKQKQNKYLLSVSELLFLSSEKKNEIHNIHIHIDLKCIATSNLTLYKLVDNYAAFFNCTPVGRASDSMMAPT